MTDRAAWLKERKKGIGGSDAAALLNVGYGCRRALWYDKVDQPPDFPKEETAAMALGTYLEPWFAIQYSKLTDRMCDTGNGRPHIHDRHPELRVNVDRLVFKDGERFAGILEIKSVGRATFYKTKREGLWPDAIIQLQHGMLVAGATWGSYAIGSRDSGELLWWDVEADAGIQATILEEGPKFWMCVEATKEAKHHQLAANIIEGLGPSRLDPDDRRCQSCPWRRTCQGEALIPLDSSGEMPQDESLRPLLDEYIERKGLLTQAEALVDESAEELKATLGDRQAVMVGKKKVFFRPQEGRVLYKGKELLEAYRRASRYIADLLMGERPSQPDLPVAEQFIDKSKPSRPLRIF